MDNSGMINAVRIYMDTDGMTPLADLAFAYGGTETIVWNNISQKSKYEDKINGYTFFFDERPKAGFDSFIKESK